MNRYLIGLASAIVALTALPTLATAQCEGGTSTAGYYLTNGTYVPGGCADLNPTTPGQLYPSGAQPLPSTNPALGVSALPGQPFATGLLPTTGGNLQGLTPGGPQTPSIGPGVRGAGPLVTIPQSPNGVAGVAVVPGPVPTTASVPLINVNNSSALNRVNPAYGYSLPAAPARTEDSPATEGQTAP